MCQFCNDMITTLERSDLDRDVVRENAIAIRLECDLRASRETRPVPDETVAAILGRTLTRASGGRAG